ncbi:MAG: polymerase III protein [Parcubacteria group bacterium GW2011_GWB1_49_7]|uniref:DNA polymerase III delta N-terminal domain-containing protein n=1 Tax=Candidatus Zambryskibacteria bacterium RIFCSPHIGHO2_01_FULL_46_25 TaxID=1802738 RepID=A0A1G2T0R1_9BACT|nr:MAG: polymerase III protein [Parcubacteria group bacterium GW2011_GWB1_49_7]OHA90419.1 MAG: hypothetical protein A2838_02395 [Candidatus Zambryskibacteria bacterium RIFCSPHIGHO2_01_FULL_46_25]OHB02186.1 MAG: hypothetical protein A3F53_01135 [Candidatus Zambryskibacteria bacterium RIFCSPHIGHO2_12_FULL_48_10]OHB06957.1 MAG: hypothetical protein A3A31_01530 [Candidatus Zambryskibacteria bacterium RIFCSPLOWO2_01_FULL_48_25]
MHHAYLLIGERNLAEERLHSFWTERGVKLLGSPDFFVFNEPLFGIDEARRLGEAACLKAFGERKIFLLSPEKITLEAQNALLKTFEDPVPDTHFFLVVREEELIIPTLRSRMEILRLANEANEANEARNFLNLSPRDRLTFAAKFADKEKNLSIFLDELLRATKSKEVYKMRLYSDDRAASPRLILEHLAVVL